MISAQVIDKLKLHFYNLWQRDNPMPSAQVGFLNILIWERQRSLFVRSHIEKLELREDEQIRDWLVKQK